MVHSDDDVTLAAEYALGTLGADERAHVEGMMAADAEFVALVRAWEWRLGALNQMVGLVEPRPVVWENIKGTIVRPAAETPVELAAAAPPSPPLPPTEEIVAEPEVTPPQSAAPPPDMVVPPPGPDEPSPEPPSPDLEVASPEPRGPSPQPPAAPAETASVADGSNIIRLDREVRRWRGIARVVSALAAALVAMLGLQIFEPDYLPEGLRPAPRTKLVQVRTPAAPPTPAAQYVALLQGQAGGPAFILTVDGASRTFTVRRVGAAPADPGKSYELWLISDRLGRPRSLGVIGATDFTVSPTLAAYDAATVNNAIYAVTVEQAGGSPDGNPHSAPVYTGKLIETVPPPEAVQQQQKR
jgi:anti-sigma-K factor RskA